MYLLYMCGSQKQVWSVFFLSLLTPQKGPKRLTHGCLPNIRIDPYIWQTPSNDLIAGLEDLAFNAWTLQNIGIDPYIWRTPYYFKVRADSPPLW